MFNSIAGENDTTPSSQASERAALASFPGERACGTRSMFHARWRVLLLIIHAAAW